MRNNTPYLNASLIREGRMIFQQFLRGREAVNLSSIRHNHARAVATPPLKCLRCVAFKKQGRKKVNDAITMFEGTALCEEHV